MTRIEQTNWSRASADVRSVRECVFVYEWRIPMDVEFDNADLQAEHVVMYEDQTPIATGRICTDGYISRVAVIPSRRNTDAATQVFEFLTQIAKTKNMSKVTVATEVSRVGDFVKAGFSRLGRAYMEAGVARQKVSCPLDKFRPQDWGILH